MAHRTTKKLPLRGKGNDISEPAGTRGLVHGLFAFSIRNLLRYNMQIFQSFIIGNVISSEIFHD